MDPAAGHPTLRSRLFKPVLRSLMPLLLGTGFSFAAEIDDSHLLIEALKAYQTKDYLLSIEKTKTLRELYPDSPLQDATLLLHARAAFRAGDNDLAARTVSRFMAEFPASPLATTIEEELQQLAVRRQNGDKLSPDLPLQAAAGKRRDDRVSLEVQPFGGQPPRAADDEREPVKAAIIMTGATQTVSVGQSGTIPFEVTNLAGRDETFLLEVSAAAEFGAVLVAKGIPGEKSARVSIPAASSYQGSIAFHMPAGKHDGQKSYFFLQALSLSDKTFSEQWAQVVTAAPQLRVVAKTEKLRLARGEQTRLGVTVLNAGSLPARELAIRVFLPEQMEFLGTAGTPGRRDGTGALAFTLDRLAAGSLEEFALGVKIGEGSPIGKELRCRVEVHNRQLLLKEVFPCLAVTVQDP